MSTPTSKPRSARTVTRVASLLRRSFDVSLCVVAIGAAGCASGPQTAPTSALTVERLYPMRPGSVWTYDVDTGEGVPTLAISRVLSKEGNKVQVGSGSDALTYELREDGLYRPDIDSYVLHTPLTKGTTWTRADGTTALITDTAKTVVAPAGDFQGCVEVLESGGASQKRVRTVFCPDVGPVEIESSLHMQLTGNAARVTAKLRGYDFSGVIGAN